MIEESQASFFSQFRLLLFFLLLIPLDLLILKTFYNYTSSSRLIMTLFSFEFLLLFLKGLLPFIKYSFNLFEILTFSHFEGKIMVFSVLEFLFSSARLILQLLLFNFIRLNFGLPLHLLADTLESLSALWNTVKKFMNSVMLSSKLQK